LLHLHRRKLARRARRAEIRTCKRRVSLVSTAIQPLAGAARSHGRTLDLPSVGSSLWCSSSTHKREA
jgi:hypothetical protein